MVSNDLAGSYLAYFASRLVFTTLGNAALPFWYVDTYAFPRWFDRFERDVTSSALGTAYFAHFLMPHAPYVFDAACRETGTAHVATRLMEEQHLSGPPLEEARIAGYREYEAQYRCVAARIERFLTQVDRLPQFRDATVVIHGDHGGRISAGMFAENVGARDMVDNYSALYAIRRPGVAPGDDPRLTSVQRLTAEYFSGLTPDELGPDNLTVVLDSREDGRVIVRPAPMLTAGMGAN
jgi:arylsulfatase A-like enzyme